MKEHQKKQLEEVKRSLNSVPAAEFLAQHEQLVTDCGPTVRDFRRDLERSISKNRPGEQLSG